MAPVHGAPKASAWVQRWSHLVAPGATVIDVACGSGRHVRWFAERGCQVTGVDRDGPALQTLPDGVERVLADLEGEPWPLAGRRFDAVVVTNYLWRALMPTLVASLAEGGVFLYETFSAGHETIGRPSNPAFLLQRAELLQAASGLRIVAFEEGVLASPERFVQRLVAVRETAGSVAPRAYLLDASAQPREGRREAAAGRVKSADSEETE